MNPNEIYNILSSANVAVSSNQGMKYISWTDSWDGLLKHYPSSTYKVHENDVGDPFFVSTMGIMIKLSVTIEGLTRTINYPVLDGKNKSMKIDGYEYTVKAGKRTVEPCSTFDINKAIMRALVKCIALFGLGIHVYKGENMPDYERVNSSQLQELTVLLSSKNFKPSELCKAWGIKKIAHFADGNFDEVIRWVNEDMENWKKREVQNANDN